MRKLFAIFIICATILYSVMLCYAGEQDPKQKDLPLAEKYETKQAIEQLNAFTAEGSAVLAEQQLNINILNCFYNLGYAYTDSFDGKSLERAMSWNVKFNVDAPIYKSELYKGYYKLRTEKPIQKYRVSQSFNREAFEKSARQEFDSYIKATLKSEASRGQLVVLLQERLMDKLLELETSKRKSVLDEIYSLRLPANTVLCNDYIYQVFERRVRTDILVQMLEINKEILTNLAHDVAIRITADKKGKLQLQYRNSAGKTEVLQILNVLKDDESYSGLTILNELYGKQDSSLLFIDSDGLEYRIGIDSALAAISLDDKGYLQLKLDGFLGQAEAATKSAEKTETAKPQSSKSAEEQIKALETSYYSKALKAQEIVKELNRYSMYRELKNKGVNNFYTRKFEADKKLWKVDLDKKLSSFGPGGMADFAAYIKQFVLLNRSELGKSVRGRILTARFRNSIIQFRQPDDSSIWITDLLYDIKYMKL